MQREIAPTFETPRLFLRPMPPADTTPRLAIFADRPDVLPTDHHGRAAWIICTFVAASTVLAAGCNGQRQGSEAPTSSATERVDHAAAATSPGLPVESKGAANVNFQPFGAMAKVLPSSFITDDTSCGYSLESVPAWDHAPADQATLWLWGETEASGCDGERPHDWDVEVRSSDPTHMVGATVVLTATMPDGHPMPVDVVGVPSDEPGHFTVEGVRFDRSGTWRIEIVARAGDHYGRHRSTIRWDMAHEGVGP